MTPGQSFADLPLEQRLAGALSSPSAFYMTGEDALQLSGWNITSNVRLTVSGRFMSCDGRVQSFGFDLALTTDRVIASVVRQLGEGWLLNFTVNTGGVTSPYGATFARVQVVRGMASSGVVLGTLASGYITAQQPIFFPGGKVGSSFDGQGNIREITGSDPAAGAEISETVPTGARWRLISFSANLVTDATVANRQPLVLLDDGGVSFYRSGVNRNHVASTSIPYVWAAGNGVLGDSLGAVLGFLPTTAMMQSGYRVRTATTAIVAGDNWGPPQLLVEEWLEAN